MLLFFVFLWCKQPHCACLVTRQNVLLVGPAAYSDRFEIFRCNCCARSLRLLEHNAVFKRAALLTLITDLFYVLMTCSVIVRIRNQVNQIYKSTFCGLQKPDITLWSTSVQ